MPPAIKATIFTIPAARRIRLVLWTLMAVDTLRIRAIHLVVARCHARDFPQDAALALRQRVGVRMRAVVRRAVGRALQVKDVA